MFFALAIVFGLLIGMFLDFPAKRLVLSENEAREEKIKQIIDYVDFEYVDQVNTDSLLDITITDLLRKLDPHSTYIPLEEVAANEESIKGSFEGIGIEFKIFRDTLAIVNVLEGGPSSEAGLKAGSRILFADNQRLFGEDISNNKIIGTLKGKSGTKVKLDIYNPMDKKRYEKTIKRGKVPIKSVITRFMLNDSVGYLKLVRFAETSASEVEGALKYLNAQGAERLIFDLRDNPGGLLSAARDISDEFLGKGELIVFTKDRKDARNEIYAKSKGLFEEGDVVILLNEGSASASEIVAGALQDNDRAFVIGRRSFGKGLVQEEMTLKDGSKIRLTTQRYYTPTGRSIQKPYEDYNQSNRYDSYRKTTVDSSRAFVTPKGKKVYGGGGIAPDFEVPFDTSKTASILYHFSMRVNFDDKSFSYVDINRSALAKYSKKSFIESFEVSEDILQFYFEKNVEKVKKLDAEILKILKLRIKSFIAYNLFDNGVYLESYSGQDPFVKKALEILTKR
jgi:carboxyl-terminal processing protease